MRFLLDSNAMIELLNTPVGPLAERVRRHRPADIGLSSIVAFELYYGAHNSQRQIENLTRLDNLRLEVLAFDLEDARHAGEIRSILKNAGIPIVAYDTLIAGQARARGLVLISHNLREFQRVPNLRVESWM
jgi:tRNA(fMet)-specific endonuclease VapC